MNIANIIKSINQCLKFKNYVQNLIDKGNIELEGSVSTSNNQPSPNHQSNNPTSNPTSAPKPQKPTFILPLSTTPNNRTSNNLSSNHPQSNPNQVPEPHPIDFILQALEPHHSNESSSIELAPEPNQ